MDRVRHNKLFSLRTLAAIMTAALSLTLISCEVDSFFDPSVVGRWERTPVVLPILEQLDIIDEPPAKAPGTVLVMPEDLVPDISEYVMGPGDLITVTIFELLSPNLESVQTRRIDELGMIRLPVVGAIKVSDTTPSRLEKEIARVLDQRGVLKSATVSVIVQEGRQKTYSVIGEQQAAGTAIGTYTIPHTDFRLLEAAAMARGMPGRLKRVYIIRAMPRGGDSAATNQTRADAGNGKAGRPSASAAPEVPAGSELIDELVKALEPAPPATNESRDTPAGAIQRDGHFGTKPGAAAPPAPLQSGLESANSEPPPWVNVDGKWVRVDRATATKPSNTTATTTRPASPSDPSLFASPSATPGAADAPSGDSFLDPAPIPPVTQRIVEVPYDRLLDGDQRYNVVIRPGDVIRVPAPVIGNVYIGGAIARPGTYGLPGDKDLTLKQLVFAAGNLTGIAIPERLDLIRRVGDNQEAVIRLNLRAIFDGTQPDVFLKPNDTVNVGTSYVATPLAVIRNGFRASYGFGFILDRNFGPDVFGPEPSSDN